MTSRNTPCVGRIIGFHPEVGELWVAQHEWRQRWVSYISPSTGEYVSSPEAYYCIHCLAVEVERTNADR